MSVLTGPIPTPRTDSHAPAVTMAERERFAYLLLDLHGAAAPLRPARYESWWAMAAAVLPLLLDAAILPFPEPESSRAVHADIRGLTRQQLTNERRLLNLRLSMQSFREWATGAPSPGPWLAERYQKLTEALHAHA